MFELLWKTPCSHEKITMSMKSGYCPDCGEYVENHWYITRCACCGVKQKPMFKGKKVTSEAKFCRNCGCNSFVTEEIESLDISNINYAIVQKQTCEIKRQSTIQTWVDENRPVKMRLIPAHIY